MDFRAGFLYNSAYILLEFINVGQLQLNNNYCYLDREKEFFPTAAAINIHHDHSGSFYLGEAAIVVKERIYRI